MSSDQKTKRHVCIIGAGLVGAVSAIECLRLGNRVTIIEPHTPGAEHAATYGNGGWVNPAAIMPISTPGLWRKVPGFLMDPLGPFAIRWRSLVRLTPWLLRFVLAGNTLAKVRRTARARLVLSETAVLEHKVLAEQAGVADLLIEQGLLYVFSDRDDYIKNSLEWQLRRELSIPFIELDDTALKKLQPGLGARYTFGVMLTKGAHITDPGTYCKALVDYAVSLGAHVVKTKANSFVLEGKQLKAVETDHGRVVCDKAIVCSGYGSKQLAAQCGDRIPLETERGYHVVVSNPEVLIRHPMMPCDGKMAVTQTLQGLRLAGQVELASFDAPANWRRSEILLSYLRHLLPDIPAQLSKDRLRFWMGHRPSTPDGLPCLGRSTRSGDILYGFGHGHTGITMAPASARLLAALASESDLPFDPTPYSPSRF